jgi:hypothetical protein
LSNLKCIRNMINLTGIDLSNNKFQFLKPNGFKKLAKLKSVNFQNNPLKRLMANVVASSKGLTMLYADNLIGFGNLKKLYPNIWYVSMSTLKWNCTYFDWVTSVLKNQSLYLFGSGCLI